MAIGLLAGCSSGENNNATDDSPTAVEENVRQLPRIAGTPTDAGYLDGGMTLLKSADPDSGEALMPAGKSFLLAVRLDVERTATLVPDEYFVIVDRRRYRPKGIAFGEARQTFFDAESFLAPEVKLSPGGSDQITTNDAGKLDGCRLASGEVYLLYRVPGSGILQVRYDGQDYDLRPTTAVALGVEEPSTPVSTTDQNADGGPQGLQLEVERGQLAISPIDGADTEVFELELTLKGSKYETVELKILENFFLQGGAAGESIGRKRPGRGGRTRRVFVEYQEDRMRLLAGTEYFDNTYNERPMKELVNGGLAVSVEPGKPLTMFCVFPNPSFENGLALHFPDKPPLDVVPAGDVLGEIRPAIARGVAKIPRAPIIGTPVKVVQISGGITVDAANKKLQPMNPGGGNRFLGLRFKIEGERQFVARDYVLTDDAETNYYPVAIAFGRAEARRVPGDGYQAVKLVPGETDVARFLRGKLDHWQYAHPEFLVLYALPQDLNAFVFSHGNRVLKITPVSPPVSWKQARSNGGE